MKWVDHIIKFSGILLSEKFGENLFVHGCLMNYTSTLFVNLVKCPQNLFQEKLVNLM